MGGTAEIVDRLVAGKLDLAICYAVPKLPEIRVLASIQPSSGIVVARDHPLAGRKSIRLAECANYSFVFPDSSLTSRRILRKPRWSAPRCTSPAWSRPTPSRCLLKPRHCLNEGIVKKHRM